MTETERLGGAPAAEPRGDPQLGAQGLRIAGAVPAHGAKHGAGGRGKVELNL